MTSKEWILDNPDVTKEQIINELIEWRQRAKEYHKQLILAGNQLAEYRYKEKDKELFKYRDRIIQNSTDGEKGFNEYLKSKHVNIITDNSICLYAIFDDHILLYHLEAFNRTGYKEGRNIGLKLFEDYTIKLGLPVLYTGKKNLFKNNSIERHKNLWQFVPKEIAKNMI